MDPTVRRRWTADHQADLAGRYATTVDTLELLDGFESFVFEDRAGDRVIRVGHSARRPLELVEGELEWLAHLAAHHVPVAEARQSAAGAWVEHFDDGAGAEFLAAAFRRAPGRQLAVHEWTPAFARHYGTVLGRIHRVSRDFAPRHRRPAWNDARMLDVRRHLPGDQLGVTAAWDRIYAQVAGSECPPDRRGLIHQDAHGGNFFVDDGELTLFDFDDCCYAPFAMELALVIFYAVVLLEEPDRFAAWFVPSLLAGYRSELPLPLEASLLTGCMALREIDIYAMFHRDGEQDSEHPWTSGFMRGRRERIESGAPLVALRPEWLAGE